MNCPICSEHLAGHDKRDLDTCATKLVGKKIKPTTMLNDVYAMVRVLACTIRVFSDGPAGVSVFIEVPGEEIIKSYAWENPKHKKRLVKELLELAITVEPDISGFEADEIIVDEAVNIELKGEGIDAATVPETD